MASHFELSGALAPFRTALDVMPQALRQAVHIGFHLEPCRAFRLPPLNASPRLPCGFSALLPRRTLHWKKKLKPRPRPRTPLHPYSPYRSQSMPRRGSQAVYSRDGRPLVAVVSPIPCHRYPISQTIPTYSPHSLKMQETKPPFKEKIRRLFGMRPKRYIAYTPALGFQSGPSYRTDFVPRSSVRVNTTGGSYGGGGGGGSSYYGSGGSYGGARRSSSSRRRY